MAIKFADNLSYSGKKPDFVRQQYDTIEAMKAVKDSAMPELYIAFCLEDRKVYLYDKSNEADETYGKFREFTSGSGSQVEELPVASSSNEGKVYQYVGETDATHTKGYFYVCKYDSTEQEVSVETVTKLTEVINASTDEITLKIDGEADQNVTAYLFNSKAYFVYNDSVYSAIPVEDKIETIDALLAEIDDSETTAKIKEGSTFTETKVYSNAGTDYFVHNDTAYAGLIEDNVVNTVAELLDLISASDVLVTVLYSDGETEEKNAFVYNDTYFISDGGVIHGGTLEDEKLVYDNTTTYSTDETVAELAIVNGTAIVLSDSTALTTDSAVAERNIVKSRDVTFDPATDVPMTDETVVSDAITVTEEVRDYYWDYISVSSGSADIESISIDEIDALFD